MATKTAQQPSHEGIYSNVQSHYSRTAASNDSDYGQTVASAFGYSKDELTNIPKDSNLGLSCGNPFVIANLREGETVIDLGSGAGFDVFQAAKKVGKGGTVVGVDMNKDMLSRARKIARDTQASNVSFVESPITAIDYPAASTDCIISNCVINLVPEPQKQTAFNEMYRLLKPKGRVAISDILLKKELPSELKNDVALYVGCIAGASLVEGYEKYLRKAGFEDILIVPDKSDLNVYKTASKDNPQPGCCSAGTKASSCGGGSATKKEESTGDVDLNEWAASFKIYAVKPE